MNHLRLAFLFPLLIPGLASAEAPALPPGRHTTQLDGQTFTLPDGFEITLAAPAALIPRPVTAAFDEQGRLYVSDASGTNDPVQKQLKELPHRILRLEDKDGDGLFDASTVFADKMMLPQGTMWLDGSLYVGSPPSIWKLTDTDGDGVADKRVEWWTGKTLTGCANDVHGPYLGPDGWIYWTKGAFAQQTHEVNGKPFATRAGHIYRALPDGSRFEPVMTGGMDNPVDVAFNSAGDVFLSNTFIVHPNAGQRDGILHAVYGGLFGKVHDVLNGHVWTGPQVMPALVHLGPAAACGLHCHSGFGFGDAYRDNLFACQFNLRQVSRHVLSPKGSTYDATNEPFLTSENVDFHPTDVIEDADGSLLVINTGGWYKLCCPTSQFHKPDITGAIYRIRRTVAAKVEDPRGLRLNWGHMTLAEAAGHFGDPRPAVRQRAMGMVRDGGTEALPFLRAILEAAPPRPAEQRRAAVWTLARIDDPAARAMVRGALGDRDAAVRETALHAVSLWRDPKVNDSLDTFVLSGPQTERRLAAAALGRTGNSGALSRLVEAADSPGDRFLEHALCYAMIEIGDSERLKKLLPADASPRVLRIVYTALDQMPGDQLTAEMVLKHLGGNDAALEETLLWIAAKHPDWGEALAAYLKRQIDGAGELPADKRDALPRLVSRFGTNPTIQALLVERLRDEKAATEIKRLVLRAMAVSAPRDIPRDWLETLEQIIQGGDPQLLPEAIAVARSPALGRTAGDRLAATLLATAERSLPTRVRLAALAAVSPGKRELSPKSFDLVYGQLLPDADPGNRALAFDALAQSRLSTSQLESLTGLVHHLSPLEIDRWLELFAGGSDARVGVLLIEALNSPRLSSLRIDQLRPRLTKYPPFIQELAERLYAKINADAGKEKQRLEEMLAALPAGDVRRGQALFHSSKTNCSACHNIGYAGGRLGPDLTKIGSIRTERDLLEAIVFPSASLVRSYEPVQVTTKAGVIHNGLLRGESPAGVTLATGPDRTVDIAKDEIDEIVPGKISVMPAGLERVLTPAELGDLVAFLKSCK